MQLRLVESNRSKPTPNIVGRIVEYIDEKGISREGLCVSCHLSLGHTIVETNTPNPTGLTPDMPRYLCGYFTILPVNVKGAKPFKTKNFAFHHCPVRD